MDYCDFPRGKYRASVTTHYKDELKQDKSIQSNYFYFESTQEMEEFVFQSASVDVCHQYFQDNSKNRVWIAYIDEEDSVIRVKYSDDQMPYYWYSFQLPSTIVAEKCGLCFNSNLSTQQGNSNVYEFLTDEYPFLYYIRENTLYVCNLNNNTTITISENSIIDASMVRGPVAINRSYNLGLIVFFIAGDNSVFYKQYINGVWYDAEVVPALGISNVAFTKIQAFRTWDFRVGVLLKNIDNELYQYVTYTEGFSNLSNDYLRVGATANVVGLTKIIYHDFKNGDEYIKVGATANGLILYGYSAISVSAENIEDSSHNWSTTVQVRFDYPNTLNTANASMFMLTDTFDNHFVCTNVALSADGYTLTLTFDEFNAAYRANDVTVHYTAPSSGGLQSPAVQTSSFDITFVPQNLVDPGPPPEVYTIYNNGEDMKVYIQFDLNLTNADITTLGSHFSLSLSEYSYIPEGSLVAKTRSIAAMDFYNGTTDTIELTINNPNFSSAVGDITVIYDGTGGLKGIGGPVAAFSETFTPTGLTWKGNQNDVEYIKVGATASAVMTRIYYHNFKNDDEYIKVGASASAVLTDIHDL